MPTHLRLTLLVAGLIVPTALAAPPTTIGPARPAEKRAAWQTHLNLVENTVFRGLAWRSVGPVVQGGRLVDIEVVPGQPYTFYVAFASGGLWRTKNNGVSFEPIFDEQPTLIMGDIAIDPTHPETIWVGTGENNSSRSSYGGQGVFRSDDAGESWTQLGLEDSDRIGRIVIDPRNTQRVYIAVLGRLYTPGGQRGIYRTIDGGRSFQRILAGDATTGFVDLVMDPTNPDLLYAAAWQRERRPWDFREAGKGSGIYRSRDGGEHWERLGGGLPTGEALGRIGLSICRSQPRTIYALLDNQSLLPEEQWDLGDGAVTAKRLKTMSKEEFLEQDPEEIEAFLRSSDFPPELDAATLLDKIRNDELTVAQLVDTLNDADAQLFSTDIRGPELWRSDDGGESWRRTHDEPLRELTYTYGYYFGQVRVAPDDPERVYLLGVPLLQSTDGGENFRNIDPPEIHGDHQALWIDPEHPKRVLLGNDGGLAMSYDGGESWLKLNPIPVGQFYTVAVDDAKPYRIYGGLQDNGVRRGSSLSRPGEGAPWQMIGGGDGAYIAIDPRDGTVYTGYQFGNYTRYDPDGSTHELRPRAALGEAPLRYNWQTPVKLSSHNPDIVYFGANRLFRSMDRGESWSAISEDLSRTDQRGDVPFGTITSFDESELRFGLIWAGTDDGQLWLTRDGGVSWSAVNETLPVGRWVSRVVASAHDAQRAYLSLNGYRNDDTTAYLFRSDDLGTRWKPISKGLPAEAINVVREDPINPQVLYVGTDRGVYVSLDRGESWLGLGAGLPPVPVHDLVVHPTERELVAATHGRSVWVLDVLPVQELDDAVRAHELYIFPTDSIAFDRAWRARRSPWWFRQEDAPLRRLPIWSKSAGPARISVRDADDHILREETIELLAGVTTWSWDLLLDPERALPVEATRLKEWTDKEPPTRADRPWSESQRLGRPLYITPGSYQLVIERDGVTTCRDLEVKPPDKLEARVPEPPRIRGHR